MLAFEDAVFITSRPQNTLNSYCDSVTREQRPHAQPEETVSEVDVSYGGGRMDD